MTVTEGLQQNIASIRQALGMYSLRQSMNQDGQAVGKLLESMEENTEAIRRIAEPHKGNNIDVRV